VTREAAVKWCLDRSLIFVDFFNGSIIYVRPNGQIAQTEVQSVTRDDALLREAVSKLGSINQLRQAQEEAGELIAAINQYSRGRIGPSVLAEEIADMEIMIEQARVIVGDAAVDEHKKFKLQRLRAMVEGGVGFDGVQGA